MKRLKLKTIIISAILIITSLTGVAFAAMEFGNFGNGFSIENSIATDLSNIGKIVKGEFKEQYPEKIYEFGGYIAENETSMLSDEDKAKAQQYLADLASCAGYNPQNSQVCSCAAGLGGTPVTPDLINESRIHKGKWDWLIAKLQINSANPTIAEITSKLNSTSTPDEKLKITSLITDPRVDNDLKISNTNDPRWDNLNNKLYDAAEYNGGAMNVTPAGMKHLKENQYLYCLRANQKVGRYNSYIVRVDHEDVKSGHYINVAEAFNDITQGTMDNIGALPSIKQDKLGGDHFEFSAYNPYGNLERADQRLENAYGASGNNIYYSMFTDGVWKNEKVDVLSSGRIVQVRIYKIPPSMYPSSMRYTPNQHSPAGLRDFYPNYTGSGMGNTGYYPDVRTIEYEGDRPSGGNLDYGIRITNNNVSSYIAGYKRNFAIQNYATDVLNLENNTNIIDGSLDSVGGSIPDQGGTGGSGGPYKNRFDRTRHDANDGYTKRTAWRTSNVRYFYRDTNLGRQHDSSHPINLYSFEIDKGMTRGTNIDKTNIISYALAFSTKEQDGYFERAQAAIWANVSAGQNKNGEDLYFTGDGSHANCDTSFVRGDASQDDISVSDDSAEDQTNEVSTAVDGYEPNRSCLYKAGRALDLYEQAITGGDSQADHDKAIDSVENGHRDDLNYQVIVSTKGQDADYSDASDAGSPKDATGTVLIKNADGSYSYKIGPFEMSDYIYAASEHTEFFSGNGRPYPKMIGGIISGELTFIDDDGNVTKVVEVGNNGPAKVKYDSEDTNGNDSLVDPDGFLIDIPVDEYEFPRPESKFYLEIPMNECGDNATTLQKIKFVYRQTYSDGDGWVLNDRYIYSTWVSKGNGPYSGCNLYGGYMCQGADIPTQYPCKLGEGTWHSPHTIDGSGHSYAGCNGMATFTYSSHYDICNGCGCLHDDSYLPDAINPETGRQTTYEELYCDLYNTYGLKCEDGCTQGIYIHACNTYWEDDPFDRWTCRYCDATLLEPCRSWCYAHQSDPDNPPMCECDYEYVSCRCDSHYVLCPLSTYCTHGFKDCEKADPYEVQKDTTKTKIVQGQPFLVVHKTVVGLEDYVYEAEVNVRLTTHVSINKYIYDVEHNPNEADSDVLKNSDYDSTYPDAITDEGSAYADVSRATISENTKEQNPVYAEFGDIVTYHIQLVNNQKKDVTVKIQDILPEECKFISIQNITQNMEDNGIKLEVNNFVSEADLGDGEDVKLEQEPPTDTVLKDEDERTLKTDWIMVPGKEDGNTKNIATLSVKIMVEYWNNDRTFENQATIITRNMGPEEKATELDKWSTGDPKAPSRDYMRVVDNGLKLEDEPHKYDNTEFPFAGDDSVPGPVVNLAEIEPKVDDKDEEFTEETKKIESSDWYMLNNYNAFIDKHVYQYDEKMQKNNEKYSFTEKGYISNSNAGDTASLVYEGEDENVLVNGRVNTSDDHDESFKDDDNILDKVREPKEDDESTLYTEASKKIHPVSVEKTETITYAIKVSNEATFVDKTQKSAGTGNHISGSKPATQVRTSKITDYLEHGLEYKEVKAIIYDENDKQVTRFGSAEVSVTKTDGEISPNTSKLDSAREYEIYQFEIENETILNPGDYIVYFVTAEVTESNMYLYDLENIAEIRKLTNINIDPETDEDRIVKDEGVENLERTSGSGARTEQDMNIAQQKVSADWVRLKDLVISGRVWVDFNRDGYMNETGVADREQGYYNVDANGRKEAVIVKLYDDSDTLLRTTKTDKDGFYTFGRKEDGASYYDEYNYQAVTGGKTVDYAGNTPYQRVDKASNKDGNGNYQDGSQYINYYVEFEYDGVIFKSTEFYSRDDNIIRDDGENFGRYDRDNTYTDNYALHNDDGKGGDGYTYKYQVDSNAAEFRDVRKAYNKVYEYVSYNVTYTTDAPSGDTPAVFDKVKEDHASYLLEQEERKKMTARSFVKCGSLGELGADTIINTLWDDDSVSVDKSIDNTDLLWLCKKDPQGYENYPETEYLKHVNLGLELREDVDLALTKDVYQVKTIINGEEMVYSYNQNDGLNGDTEESGDYLKDYIVNKPYGLEIYESDYKYRFDQYKAKAVRDYKGEESELNVEATYRITVKHKPVSDDDELRDKGTNVKDTKLKVKLHEVLDLYDDNFIKYKDNENETITVKTKDENGFLIDTDLKIAEAWFFKEATDGATGSDGKKYIIENADEVTSAEDIAKGMAPTTVTAGGNPVKDPVKPIYKEDPNGTYIRVDLKISNTSKYSKKTIATDGYGYNTLYVTGMDVDQDYFTLEEGEERDIYVKYVLDKDALEIEVDSDSWNDTQTVTTRTVEGGFEQVDVATTSISGTTLQRSLKIAEHATTKLNPRGTENIAQINAYSVWYAHSNEEASLVDMDSNVGNIGDTEGHSDNPGSTSVDDIEYYEDTEYKTGIEIISEGTENTEDDIKAEEGEIIFRVPGMEKLSRSISGMVWDDARTDELDDGTTAKQYGGDGIYDTGDTRNTEAAWNENIPLNYDNDVAAPGKTTPDEEKDIKVRNANVEFVEIVQTDEDHYYEEILANVTWDQTQHKRTEADGSYELKGFIPGRYIIRFTYGDTVEGDATAQKDMRLFNGQDYKTTQYAYEMEDYTASGTNPDTGLSVVPTTDGTIDKYAASLELADADTTGGTGTTTTPATKEDNSIDTVLTALERPNLSDARDDEIRRLEVNNYSEVMYNQKAEILKGLANGTNLTNKEVKVGEGVGAKTVNINYYDDGASATGYNTEEQLNELTDNTYMYAETAEFLVKAEKLTYNQSTNGDYIYHKYTDPKQAKIYYDELKNMEFKTVAEREFKIVNIDMGLEYRPETAISLVKEINDIQLVTSDGELLVDLKMATERDEFGKILRHYIDFENSIGADKIQFITNDYERDALLQSIVDVNQEKTQGLIYAAVDDDILQGCKVIVQYKFTAQNNSEIDRITEDINKIRFYGNDRTQELIKAGGIYRNAVTAIGRTFYLNEIPLDETDPTKVDTEYTANNLARNIVHYDVYNHSDEDDVFRDRPKTMRADEEVNASTTASTVKPGSATPNNPDLDGTDGYFGKYVGYTYYTGNVENEIDVFSELKFDKIIDYVDTDLEFGQLTQTDVTKLTPVAGDTTGTGTTTGTTSSNPLGDVLDKNYTGNQYWSNNSTQPISKLSPYLFKLNKRASTPTTPDDGSGTPTPPQIVEQVLTDLKGVQYKSLVITTPDRESETEDDDNTRNQLFAKYLIPSVLDNSTAKGKYQPSKKKDATGDEFDTLVSDTSIATVYLPVSKTLATQTDTDNMQYENIAEVIQFTILTGRRTNFDTTIGNADIHVVNDKFVDQKVSYEPIGTIEFVTAGLETDTSSTETITLSPPTGMMRNRKVIYETIETTKNVAEISIVAIGVAIVALVGTRFAVHKIKKKRYK